MWNGAEVQRGNNNHHHKYCFQYYHLYFSSKCHWHYTIVNKARVLLQIWNLKVLTSLGNLCNRQCGDLWDFNCCSAELWTARRNGKGRFERIPFFRSFPACPRCRRQSWFHLLITFCFLWRIIFKVIAVSSRSFTIFPLSIALDKYKD